MNLLESPWMPVRRHDGTRLWIAPTQLSDPDLLAFDADRADFNGALAQFAIGLLQTTTTVDSPMAWQALLTNPPDANALGEWYLPHAAAFELDGDGARFMQDFDLRSGDGEAIGIAGLLIESPGKNALKNNSDHFIKRGHITELCPSCAAIAVFNLQVNAPEGGRGHLTGLRGGGPMTTLLVNPPKANTPRSLWHNLWLNVQECRFLLGNGGDETKTAPHFTFPWLASITALQKERGEIAPIQVHPAHVFWAMPRRVRLDFNSTTVGVCHLCGCDSDRLVHQYVTRPNGLNYKGPWKHPLSPHYYEDKDGWRPLHPRPGGIGYRHWLGWVLGTPDEKRKLEAAGVVSGFLSAGLERKTGTELQLWAFGFDMDSNKARCWYEATLPLYAVGDCSPESRIALREDVGDCLSGAEMAVSLLRGAIKDAWFGGDARGDFRFVDASFWSRTERHFYELLRERVAASRDNTNWDRPAAAERWLKVIRSAALDLFDRELVGAGPVERQHPARVAQAYRLLSRGLNGAKMRNALGLPPADKDQAESTRKAAKAE